LFDTATNLANGRCGIASDVAWSQHFDATKNEPKATADDVVWADAVLFGTPTRYGNVASQLKQFLDTLGRQWSRGQLADRSMPGSPRR
jgi:NAD(P)H dehydrogenase (quinone)